MDRPDSFELSKLEIQELSGWPDTLVEDYRNIGTAINELFDAIQERTVWRGAWVSGDYDKNDEVIDGGWLMQANKATSEKAAPVPLGDEFNVYTGTIGSSPILAKQILSGNRYTFGEGGYLTGYRLNVISGNRYVVFLVRDPFGNKIIDQIIDFTAQTTGWIEFSLSRTIIFSGKVFDIVVAVNEPDPTPTIISANYNYRTQNNETVPASGEIRHANKLLPELWINKTDNDSTDRSAMLASLTSGDIIDGAGVRWAIQLAGIDNGTYFAFVVAPAAQGTNGLQKFDFETVTPTPITVPIDVDYNLGSTEVRGLYVADGGYDSIDINNNQYGIDIKVQNASVSEDWHFKAFSG